MSERDVTVSEVITWLKANTDAQDTGAWQVSRAIAIFEEAVKNMSREKRPYYPS